MSQDWFLLLGYQQYQCHTLWRRWCWCASRLQGHDGVPTCRNGCQWIQWMLLVMDCCFTKSNLSSRRMFNSHNRVGKPMDLWHFTGFGPHLYVRSANLIRSNFRSSGALLLWDRRGSRQGSACYCHSYSSSFHGQKVNNDCVRMACVPAGYSYVLIHLTLSRLADSYMTCPSSNSFSCWCAECNSRC